MTETQWISGKEEYSISEIECMLQSQRSMIHNDMMRLLISIAKDNGLIGKLTSTGSEVIKYLKNPRTLEI